MTKQLIELENNYQLLCKILLDITAIKKPGLLIYLEEYIDRLEKLSVLERSYLIFELIESSSKNMENMESVCEEVKFNEKTIQTLKYWAHFA
ncbi:hypothetical protein GTN30_02815 [Macrococcoides canis]|uniref:Uncharacterized protein n=1 Tax=Macrococcoides canis TaxID=1855823 RepID=A0AAE6X0S7_9STAP|nr:hypothetical protein [Macrococcus canis]QIH77587.1 hypothetical protein GTN30_02815 [Macrococcus canis]